MINMKVDSLLAIAFSDLSFTFLNTTLISSYVFIKYRLIHGHFHIGVVIIPSPPNWPETESRANVGRGMIKKWLYLN